jgi:hypothetical protein
MRRGVAETRVQYGQGEEAEGFITITADTTPVTGATSATLTRRCALSRAATTLWGTCRRAGVSQGRPQTSSLVRGKGTNTLTPHQAPSPTRCRCEREQDGVAQHAERFYLHGGQEGVRYGLARRSRDLSPRPRSSESPSVRASARRPGTPSSRRRRPP